MDSHEGTGGHRAHPGHGRQRVEEHDLETHRVWVLRDARGIVTVISVARQDMAPPVATGHAANGDNRRNHRATPAKTLW